MRAATAVLAGAALLAAAAVVVADLAPVPPWAVIVGVAALVAGGVVVALRGLDDLGVGLLVLAVVTSPWNAVGVGSLKPGPVLLAAALLVLGVQAALHRRWMHLPAWIWPLTAGIVVVAGLTLLAPPSPSFMAGRFYADAPGLDLWQLQHVSWGSALDAAQWLVAVVGLPLAAWFAVALRPGLPPVLADAWVLGATTSALVSLSDQLKLTSISAQLLPFVDVGGRQAGLTVQPNHLAMGAVLTLPIAVWRIVSRYRPVMLGAVAVLLGGIVVSQSRGGLVVAVLAILVVLVWDGRGRQWLAPLGAVVVAGGVVVLAVVPSAARHAGEALRLVGQDSATASDVIRDQLAEQTFRDIGSSPWHGIGFEVAVAGHNVWLQLLACGGVILLLTFVATLAGFGVEAWRLRDRFGGLPVVLLMCVGAWLVAGIVENNLTDLFLYVPYALVAAIPVGDAHLTAAGPAVLISGGARP